MKFSDLTANMRSMISALNSTNHLNTEELGRACTPAKLSAQSAANVLNELRGTGLVYSMQKPESQQYAKWAITSVGRAVFMGRPDGDVVLQTVPATNAQAPCSPAKDAAPIKRYMVSETAGVGTFMTGERDDVLAEAQRRATAKPGTQFNVYERIATAHMPVPQAQITLL